MRIIIYVVVLLVITFAKSHAQEEQKWFDFWVGDWEVTWDEQGGKQGHGKNHVTKILDNAVIQENFKAEEGGSKGYLGTSISVYNPQTKTWHQGYADNQGAYFD